ncbi:type II toxin-antitoxin system mRNA interferase toxin, RelE/StbE family [Candidatus Uhrbacteria bacterium]|nr:type II toxin-antitoxin system mRNA interferase toxin, RelE/StbE family [Candidatus Uhrbacteria bacterium]
MIIEPHPSFVKSYQKRIAHYPKLVAKTKERLTLFVQNSAHPLLDDHALSGRKLQLRAFSVTGDIRVVYFPITEDRVLLLDIGTHNQVY